MELYSVFVTGANRGIGLGFVRNLVQLPKPPKYVFATYRSPEGIGALEDIRDKSKSSQVHLIKMDVTIASEIESARKFTEDIVGEGGLTLLINNAGAGTLQHQFPHITEDELLHHFKTNTIGPVMILQEFTPLLQKAAALRGSDTTMDVSRAAVVNISSAIGSITQIEEFKDVVTSFPSYNISKAGLNMAMRTIAVDLKKTYVLVVMICPGAVITDMSKGGGKMTADESTSAILKTLAVLNETHHGTFMDRNGNPYNF